jgi:hypothetical protein
MGKVIKRTYVTKPEQLLRLKSGRISIITGRNLRSNTDQKLSKLKPAPDKQSKPQK